MVRQKLSALVIIGMLLVTCFGCSNVQKKHPKEITSKDGAPMVLIPAGDFQMGSNDSDFDAHDNEKPVHTVYLDAFYMGVYEVTNAQYRRFVQATGHREPEGYSYVNSKWQYGFRPFNAIRQKELVI